MRLLIIIGALVVLFSACTDDILTTATPDVCERGLTDGKPLGITDDMSSLSWSEEGSTRYYVNGKVDSVMMMLVGTKSSAYNFPNHVRKYKRYGMGGWRPDSALYLGSDTAYVYAYLPDTASLYSINSDTLWMFIQNEFKVQRADSVQEDYIYSPRGKFSENTVKNLDGTFVDKLNNTSVADFTHPYVNINMFHALTEIEVRVCNLAYGDTARVGGLSYTFYSGVGNVNEVKLETSGSNKFFTQIPLDLKKFNTNGLALVKSVPNVKSSKYLKWGRFGDPGSTVPVPNINRSISPINKTKSDTAIFSCLAAPGVYNNLSVSVTVDNDTRLVNIKKGTTTSWTFKAGQRNIMYVTICSTPSDSMYIVDAYVLDWRHGDPGAVSFVPVKYFCDDVLINYDSSGNILGGIPRQPYCYERYNDPNPTPASSRPYLIYAYDRWTKYSTHSPTCPGHATSLSSVDTLDINDLTLNWTYPSTTCTNALDKCIYSYNAACDKVYVYMNPAKYSAGSPSAVLYNTYMKDSSGNLVYQYLSSSDMFIWEYPTAMYTAPDGTKVYFETNTSNHTATIKFIDAKGLYYDIWLKDSKIKFTNMSVTL